MTVNSPKDILLIALGGNALIREGQVGTIAEQFANLHAPLRQVARLSRRYRLLITYGNGPQVGHLLLQQERSNLEPKLPLELLVAQTQGQIGYMIESTLDNEFRALGITPHPQLVSLLSYVVVDEQDPAFQLPSKPIGPIYSAEEAATLPHATRKTAKGYRRVVASPKPLTIVEKHEIMKLMEMDFVVICCGGGGIPVIREGRAFHGVDAVIDKDLTSAKLAEEVGVDTLLIATDVEGAALHYGRPHQQCLRTLTLKEADQFQRDGQFPPGSMGPKIEAATAFLRSGGKRAIITSIDAIESAIAGQAGTELVRDRDSCG
ncbi:MAG: carbamate kinase [Candidatus Tectomicrobia bacterium]|nr:carbamate kinase [Candidatus Tectomicrobia bacterium]